MTEPAGRDPADEAPEDLEALQHENRRLRRQLERERDKGVSGGELHAVSQNVLRGVMADLEAERARSEQLLLNILPPTIAERLKAGTATIADDYAQASVMFVDLVGFTPLSEELSASDAVAWLNELYSTFDALVQEVGVEKIRTIGDGYMVAAGVPEPRDDHAHALVRLGLDIQEHVRALDPVAGRQVEARIGINSGPMVGGVIGTHKFQFDVWGDAVNVAARMESHGVPGRVQVSETTHELIRDDFECEPRGPIEVKGKGVMHPWLVVGPRPEG